VCSIRIVAFFIFKIMCFERDFPRSGTTLFASFSGKRRIRRPRVKGCITLRMLIKPMRGNGGLSLPVPKKSVKCSLFVNVFI
jgi:hypothetical protein